MGNFRQNYVFEIGAAVFGLPNMICKQERALRFFEEACETAQATKMTRAQAHAMVDYVFDREIGNVGQELAGANVTLYSLAAAYDLDLDDLTSAETLRIIRNIDKCRAKHAAKPSIIKAA